MGGKTRHRKPDYGGTALGVLFIGIVAVAGAAALWHGAASIARANASFHWQSVPGEVFRNEITTSTTPDTPDMHAAMVWYRYRVGEDVYTNWKVGFEDNTSYLRSEVEALAAQYPVGTKVTVFYDPDDPGQSRLRRGPWYVAIFEVITGGALLLAAFVLASIRLRREWASDRARRRSAPSAR